MYRDVEILPFETKSKIVNCVRDNRNISRNELAELTGLSNSTVTRIIESLINNNDLIEESGYKSIPRGRPKRLLNFKGRNKYIIGIDIGTTYIRGLLSDYNAEHIKEIEIVNDTDRSVSHVTGKIESVVDILLSANLVDKSKIKGIGIAVAGMINGLSGIIEYSPAFNWKKVNLLKILKQRIELPLYYDNVSRLMALGEQFFGSGSRYNNFLVINVGYGIGAGIVINGHIYYGTNGITGEFGHYPIKGDDKVKCACGNNNCLTSYSSGDAIAKRVSSKIKDGRQSKLTMLSKDNCGIIDAELVAKACEEGDVLSLEIFNKSMEYLGISIAGIINVLNPEAVFIGGGVAQAGSVFWDNLLSTIEKNLFNCDLDVCPVKPVSFPYNSAIIGAVSLVLREVLCFRL
ncbi:MAG: ROK family transcriptional regulator [Deltaproteobacteria bacterium]|nr:ROK family transcriptional regulator [Deltaproteobacteria bacterium]